MSHKPGDRILVFTPGGPFEAARTDEGVVKIVQSSTGRVFWYHPDPSQCGMCGSKAGEGHHRLGMFGSKLV